MIQFLFADVAVWVLVLSLMAFLRYASRSVNYRMAWERLRERRAALVCAGIVSLYLGVGLLDSIHLGNESVLDKLVGGLKVRTEKTFSAPFATHLYQKEQTGPKREYPRLQFGGAHLKNPEDAPFDILRLTVIGLTIGCVIGGAAVWLFRRVGRFLAAVAILVSVVAVLASHYHVLGTNRIGQDVLYLALKGCRTSLILGTVTTLIATPFAMMFGIAAGYFGGRVDDVIQYVYTTLSSIPGILLIAAAMLIVQSGISGEETIIVADRQLFWLCIVLGVVGWTGC